MTVSCDDTRAAQTLASSYRLTSAPTPEAASRRRVHLTVMAARDHSYVITDAGERVDARGVAALRYWFDKRLTLALQRARPDLFFVHAAVLRLGARTLVVAAPSGTGKSTLAWYLARHGFVYVSDELAPIDVRRMRVHAYARALHLKARRRARAARPVVASPSPNGTHVAPAEMPGGFSTTPGTLAAVFFLFRARTGPTMVQLGPAESAARLMSSALNPLAHSGHGVDAALRIATRIPCFTLNSTSLHGAARAIRSALA